MRESEQSDPIQSRREGKLGTAPLDKLQRFGLFVILLCSVLHLGCGASSEKRGEQSSDARPLREQLENFLDDNQFSDVILIDEETPFPSVPLGIIVVDGDFYEDARASAREYLRSQAHAGVPIVFAGGDFDSFCQDIGIGHETIEEEDEKSQSAPLRVAASALKLYSGQAMSPLPRYAEIRVAGDADDPAEALIVALEWAETVMEEGLPLGMQPQIPATEGSIPSSDEYPSHWDWYAHYEFATAGLWKDHGQLNIRRTWYRVLNEKGISPYDPRLLKISMEIVPGALAYSSGWKNSGTWAIVDVNERGDGCQLVNYGPTTAYDTDGAQAIEWDYEIRDVKVKDMGNMSEERAYWWHDIDERAEVGRIAYEHNPGLVYTCNGGEGGSLLQRYRAEFAKKTFSSWEHWKSAWINMVTTEAPSPPHGEIGINEARAILDQAVSYAQARNLGGLCQLGGSANMCQHQFTSAGGWVTVPSEHPEIADIYYLPTKHFKNGFQATGGRVLVLEGINGVGETYRTDFLVFETDDPGAGSEGLAVINVVYWSGFGIAQPNDNGTVTTGRTPQSE
ncbi:MAG: hypothetical protein ABIN58_01180 [candidate division WOR-3 bacterium]